MSNVCLASYLKRKTSIECPKKINKLRNYRPKHSMSLILQSGVLQLLLLAKSYYSNHIKEVGLGREHGTHGRRGKMHTALWWGKPERDPLEDLAIDGSERTRIERCGRD
jgi:hypothetical protein